jgi:UDP-glucuronate 4-epimerase
MHKKVFITGAAGFIGFHLASYLHSRGDKVVGYDNFNSYYDPALKRKRAKLLKAGGVEIIDADICDHASLKEAVEKHQVTHFVHLAAQAGVRYSLTDPEAYIKSNINGFLHVLELCRQIPEIKLTYASSSSVYGLNKKTPFAIGDRTDHQANLYGVTKKTNELMAQTYHHLYGIAATGLRFFTVYGPWGRPDMAYYKFTEAILNEKPIDLYNFGEMQRDFTYIDDIVAGTVAAIDLESPLKIFNLGHHKPVPLMHMVSKLEELLGKKAKINTLPMQPGDVLSTYADIEESADQLKFIPTTNIEDGLAKFVAWYHDYK